MKHLKTLLAVLMLSGNLYGGETLFSSANIPLYDSNAEFCIPFYMSRDLDGEGALRKEIMELLCSAFQVRTFIETGTYLGFTTKKAAQIFEQVYTIELSHNLFKLAQKRLEKYQNIVPLEGNSPDVLAQLLPNISSRILFYLDGHFSAGITAKGSSNTPIIEELKAIKNANKKDALILIDDVRGFQKSIYPEKLENSCMVDFPQLSDLLEVLLQINPQYQISFFGDALMAFPPVDFVTVSPVLASCGIHRLGDLLPGSLEHQQEQADEFISKVKDFERKELLDYFEAYSPVEFEMGWQCYGALWRSLIFIEEGQKEEGLSLLQAAVEKSLPNWRAEKILLGNK